MKVFLIRHGRSEDSENQKKQSPESPLGKIGKVQARLLARRLKKEKIDVLLSSPWPRALQTAEAIAKTRGIKVELLDGIHEKEAPSEIYGNDIKDKTYLKFLRGVKKNATDFDWKYKGSGESLRDVIKRAISLKKHLIKNHLGQNVVLASHGIFIRCFLTTCILDKKYDDKTFYKIFDVWTMDNTGVTLLEYEEEKRKWSIIYVNDHSHLRLDKV